MNLHDLKACLLKRPDLPLALELPGGRRVPAHYHVTEVGHVVKKFVDCGGKFRATETCVLQTHVGSPRDDGHRLTAGRLAHILGLADSILPSAALPVEVEYEDGVISQFPVAGADFADGALALRLGLKHTDCLAKEKCGAEDAGGGVAGKSPAGAGCCAGAAGRAACCS